MGAIMNVLSLFDGMSCGQIAFDKLGIKFDGNKNKYFASEIKKSAIEVTKHNYPNTIHTSVPLNSLENEPEFILKVPFSPCFFIISTRRLSWRIPSS